MEYRIPKYLHRPYQVLFLDSDDLALFMFVLIVNLIFDLGGWGWGAGLVTFILYIKYKHKKARGYLRHLLYSSGLFVFKGAPNSFEKRFVE